MILPVPKTYLSTNQTTFSWALSFTSKRKLSLKMINKNFLSASMRPLSSALQTLLSLLQCGFSSGVVLPKLPNIVFILQDDLGLYDVAFTTTSPSHQSQVISGNLTQLAKEGVVLKQHYVHWHCSPTRRSLLTGRLPVHHSEMLSNIDTDDIDVRIICSYLLRHLSPSFGSCGGLGFRTNLSWPTTLITGLP